LNILINHKPTLEIIILVIGLALFIQPITLIVYLQVSRCGMIYMEPSSMGWRPIFTSWLNMLPQTLTDLHRDVIKELFNRFVDAGKSH